jgi:hypothetical protein
MFEGKIIESQISKKVLPTNLDRRTKHITEGGKP